jgi:hypothetical protein
VSYISYLCRLNSAKFFRQGPAIQVERKPCWIRLNKFPRARGHPKAEILAGCSGGKTRAATRRRVMAEQRWARKIQRLNDFLAEKYQTVAKLRKLDIRIQKLFQQISPDRIDLSTRIISFEVKRRRTQKPKPAEVYIVDELFNQVFSGLKTIRPAGGAGTSFNSRAILSKALRRLSKCCARKRIPYGNGRKVKNGLTLHDFRHTSITDMRRAGVDPLVNKVWHGYSSRREPHSGYHTVDREDGRT